MCIRPAMDTVNNHAPSAVAAPPRSSFHSSIVSVPTVIVFAGVSFLWWLGFGFRGRRLDELVADAKNGQPRQDGRDPAKPLGRHKIVGLRIGEHVPAHCRESRLLAVEPLPCCRYIFHRRSPSIYCLISPVATAPSCRFV